MQSLTGITRLPRPTNAKPSDASNLINSIGLAVHEPPLAKHTARPIIREFDDEYTIQMKFLRFFRVSKPVLPVHASRIPLDRNNLILKSNVVDSNDVFPVGVNLFLRRTSLKWP